jgi:hypothetical protein
VINVSFVGAELLAGVLAAATVASPDGPGIKRGSTLRHLGKAAEHDDMGYAHCAFRRANRIVVLPHRQLDPLRPAHGHHVVAINVEGGSHIGGHLHERLLGGAHIDGLPVAVKHQYNRSVEYVVHKFYSL